MYRKSPSTAEIPPPDAPYSGYLVITDEEAEDEDTCCWRICRRKNVKRLPFPQDKMFSVFHPSENEQASSVKVWFLPVPDHALSSNRYYVIRAKGRHKGYVYFGLFIIVFECIRNLRNVYKICYEILFIGVRLKSLEARLVRVCFGKTNKNSI